MTQPTEQAMKVAHKWMDDNAQILGVALEGGGEYNWLAVIFSLATILDEYANRKPETEKEAK